MAENVSINPNNGITSSIMSNIKFTNIDLTKGYTSFGGTIFTQKGTIYDPNNGGTGKNTKPFQCVDINWNGAILPNVSLSYLQNNNTINTSGDLLALINDMQGQINVLAELVTSYMG